MNESGLRKDEDKVAETGDRARQGVTGHKVRYVLFFGVIGVIAAFVVLLAAFQF